MDHCNQKAVQEQLTRLKDTYGNFPVEREDPPFEAPPELFDAYVEAAHSGRINSSYTWVRRTPDQFPPSEHSLTDDAKASNTRVLFIYNRADDHTWTIPGGGREPGEFLEEAAHRELGEETGIKASITGIRKVKHNIAVPADDVTEFDADAVHSICPIFNAEYEAGKLDIQLRELYGAAWFDRTPTNLHRLVADQSITAR